LDLLAHSSAIEIDDILKDFSPHRAVRAHEPTFIVKTRLSGISRSRIYPYAPLWRSYASNSQFVAESGESVDLVEARISAKPWRLRAEPSLSRGSSSNAPYRNGNGRCNHANNKLMLPEATPDRTGHAIVRSDRTCGRNVRKP